MKRGIHEKEKTTERKMNRNLKKRMIKTLVWSVVLYGSETWTMRKEDIRRLEAFEMWTWRRMEKISWTEHQTNEEFWEKLEKREISYTQLDRDRGNGLDTH